MNTEINKSEEFQKEFELALDQYDLASTEEDYKQALEVFKRLATFGHVEAMLKTGYILANGLTGYPNYDEAFSWLEKAAERGDVDALNNLGVMCLNGWGLDAPDVQRAYELFSHAALAGNAKAQITLADGHQSGRGVERDLKSAIHWYREAALQGEPWAMYYLGELYRLGDYGLEPDLQEAILWYLAGAELSHPECQYSLGLIGEENSLSSVAEKSTREWFELAAAQGHDDARAQLSALESKGSFDDFLRKPTSKQLAEDCRDSLSLPNTKEVFLDIVEDREKRILLLKFGLNSPNQEMYEFSFDKAPSQAEWIEYGFHLIAQDRCDLLESPAELRNLEGDRVVLQYRVCESEGRSLRGKYRLSYEISSSLSSNKSYSLAGLLDDWYYGEHEEVRQALVEAKIERISRLRLEDKVERGFIELIRSNVNSILPSDLG